MFLAASTISAALTPLTSTSTAVRTVEALGGDPEKIVKRREDGNFRNLAFSTAKLEAAGIFFPDTIEGILNRLTHLSEKF